MHENLRFDKFESVNFKHDNSFSKLRAKCTPITYFGPNLIFFAHFFVLWQIWGCWFKLQSKTQSNRAFLVPRFFSTFPRKIYNLPNSRVLIWNMTIFYKITAQKYPYKAFLDPNLRTSIFAQNFDFWKISNK